MDTLRGWRESLRHFMMLSFCLKSGVSADILPIVLLPSNQMKNGAAIYYFFGRRESASVPFDCCYADFLCYLIADEPRLRLSSTSFRMPAFLAQG